MSNTIHKPVLCREVVKYLDPCENDNFVDCTVGGGGHTRELLKRNGPKGQILAFDWDQEALNKVKESLSEYEKRLILIRASYTKIKQYIFEKDFFPIKGIVLDLGLSSDQLQDSGRGFSFQVKEPLDMRYSPEDNNLTAEKIINQWPEKELIKMLKDNSEEKKAKSIARVIVEERKKEPIKNTLQLAGIIVKNCSSTGKRIHPATKTFQALRIEVNDELENLKNVLNDIVDLVESGTRLAVISFHSLEDRIVKNFFKRESKGCICSPETPVCTCGHKAKIKIITKKPITPSSEEIKKNFRSRSAKLRVAQFL